MNTKTKNEELEYDNDLLQSKTQWEIVRDIDKLMIEYFPEMLWDEIESIRKSENTPLETSELLEGEFYYKCSRLLKYCDGILDLYK